MKDEAQLPQGVWVMPHLQRGMGWMDTCPSLDTSLTIMKISQELLWVALCLAEVVLLQLGMQELT